MAPPDSQTLLDCSKAALLLAQPLIKFLRGQPSLNVTAVKCLADLRSELDTALSRSPTYPSHTVNLRSKKTSHDLHEDDEPSITEGHEQKISKGAATVSPLPSSHLLSTRASVQPKSDAHHDKSGCEHWQSSQRRRRILMAVDIFTELDDRESKQTLMEKLLGRSFYRGFCSIRKRMKLFLQLVTIVSRALFLPSLVVAQTDILGPTFGASCVVLTLLDAFSQSAVINYHVSLRCIQTFEGLVLTTELFLFCGALAALLCFSTLSLAIAPALFVSIWMPVLFRDAFPATVRKNTRYLAIGCTVPFIATLAIFYFRLSSSKMCPYRLDLEDGIFMEELDESGRVLPSTRSRWWSISLLDFMLNRGMTILVYMTKMTYLAFQHPQDCVIVKSRVRFMEMMNNATGRCSACSVHSVQLAQGEKQQITHRERERKPASTSPSHYAGPPLFTRGTEVPSIPGSAMPLPTPK